MTQRDGMGRDVGGGFRMGNTCKSMADSCQCMAKTTTVLKSNFLNCTLVSYKMSYIIQHDFENILLAYSLSLSLLKH